MIPKIIKKMLPVLVLCSLLLLTACHPSSGKPKHYHTLKLFFLAIGKADCMLLKTSSSTIVVDSGNDFDSKTVLASLKREGIRTIDHLIITHFDKDHVGGANILLSNFKILNVYMPNYQNYHHEFIEFSNELFHQNISPNIITGSISMKIDDILLKINGTEKSKYDYNTYNDNEYSLVVDITHGDSSIFLTGDANKGRLKELLDDYDGDLQHTLLKLPHHGLPDPSVVDFAAKVHPQYAIITDGGEVPYFKNLIHCLKKQSSKIYSTKNGTIEAISDGKKITIVQPYPAP